MKTDHPAHYIANEMAFAHNAMLRGLNAIYLQACHVPQADVPDFLFFAASWAQWLLHHHTIEETEMFPNFEDIPGVVPNSLQQNVDQHHEFSAGVARLRNYATNTEPEKYSGAALRSIIEKFGDTLRQHLAEEIDTLWAMESVPVGADSEALLQVYRRSEAVAGQVDKNVVPPMVLGLCDKTFEGGNDWPKMPMGSAYFVHYWFARKHSGVWRFLPCDTFGQPRPLAFLGQGDGKK